MHHVTEQKPTHTSRANHYARSAVTARAFSSLLCSQLLLPQVYTLYSDPIMTTTRLFALLACLAVCFSVAVALYPNTRSDAITLDQVKGINESLVPLVAIVAHRLLAVLKFEKHRTTAARRTSAIPQVCDLPLILCFTNSTIALLHWRRSTRLHRVRARCCAGTTRALSFLSFRKTLPFLF